MAMKRLGRVVFVNAVLLPGPTPGSYPGSETTVQDPIVSTSRQAAEVELYWHEGCVVIRNKKGGREERVPGMQVRQMCDYVEPAAKLSVVKP